MGKEKEREGGTGGGEGKKRVGGVEALAAQKARMQAKKEERDEETGFFQLGQVGASNLGGPQPPSENNLHAATAAATAAAAAAAAAAATPSSSSSSQRARGCSRFGIKKGDASREYAGALGHPLFRDSSRRKARRGARGRPREENRKEDERSLSRRLL